ncbi:MAG TPA: response regulator [Chloroflexi bacterium]|nr:response regulator [Chloroflexota bacterium]
MNNQRPKILVVDDLVDWRTTLGGLLVDVGYQVAVAESSAAALDLLKTEHFDLVLLDVRLDETDEESTEGLTLAGEIKDRWPSTKIIIITGYGTSEILNKAMETDAEGRRLAANYIEKTKTGELVQVVRDALKKE